MTLNFGKLFQSFSKDKTMRGLISISQDSSLWPKEWKTIYYKTYDRFPKIKLPDPQLVISFKEALLGRRSVREFKNVPINLSQISSLLYYSAGIDTTVSTSNKERRFQPSGGGRYPIEIYIIPYREGDLEKRVYHYNVKEHALDVLWKVEDESLFRLCSYDWSKDAGFIVVLTAVTHRATMKYGERGYRYMYLEAGAIVNNLNLLAKDLGLGVCIMGGTNDSLIEKVLDVDGERETILIGVVGGVDKFL